jgi:GR25 family glycosyltransferase involved in LPS biosynthesis
VQQLIDQLPCPVEKIEAVYPGRKAVPFQGKILQQSKQRTGRALLPGELGCLMSHRQVWRNIISSSAAAEQHFLILESDSQLLNADLLTTSFKQLTQDNDLFFWGAWEGHMQFFNSTKQSYKSTHQIGVPFIKTVYCTYGYSLNKKAAQLLLERTKQISYPVDQFKFFFNQQELKLGGILPEVITGNQSGSTIRNGESLLFKKAFLMVLDLKNYLICSLR